MPETAALIGYGTKYEISTNGGSTWAEVEEISAVTPPSATIDMVDATHMQSPNRTREFIPGMNDAGESSFSVNFIPGSDSDVLIRGLQTGFTRFSVRITYPNGVTWTFSGQLMSYTPSVPLDDKMTADITIKVSGSFVTGAAAAPANTVRPAISGIAQVGQVLTAWPGMWTGSPAFTFVWKADSTPIGGATGPTYTPVIGQIGDVITVAVTGTNTAGNVAAESVGTAAVIAA